MSDETNEYYMRCVHINKGAKGETEYFVKVDMEEHDLKVRSEMLGEVIKAIDESNYCMLEDCPFYKQCGYHLCPLDSNGLTIIQTWLEKWMEQLKEK